MTTTEMQQILSRLNVLESELTVGQAAIMRGSSGSKVG